MKSKPTKLEFWKDRRGKLRWHLKTRNGQITDAASQGFSRFRSCISNLYWDGVPTPLVQHVPLVWQWGKSRCVITAKGAVWS